MPVFYIEASALVKRYRTEEGTEVVDAVFDERTNADVLVTSHLITVEVESAAARGLKGRVLNRAAYGAMLRAFADDLETMMIVPVSTNLLAEAVQTARQHALRALDAVHFATAVRVSRAAPQPLVFVASDKELLQAAQASGFVALDPLQDGALNRLRRVR